MQIIFSRQTGLNKLEIQFSCFVTVHQATIVLFENTTLTIFIKVIFSFKGDESAALLYYDAGSTFLSLYP